MTEIHFYHLTQKTVEQTLPALLEKTFERGLRAVVLTGSNERVESLTQHLWTYKQDSFLPHGNGKDGHAEQQPIWLTAIDENPNQANILFLTDGTQSTHIHDYQRVCELFDGQDDAAVAAARKRWSAYKTEGHTLSYWQQGERGWIDMANGQ